MHAESKLDFERLTNERFKEKRHGRKAKNGKGHRAKDRSHRSTRNLARAQPAIQRAGQGAQKPQHLIVKAARDQVLATARGRSRTISELQATAMSSLWL